MPAGIPEDVVHMDLSNNSISHLKAKDFLGTKSLRTLNISHNNLQQADTGTSNVLMRRPRRLKPQKENKKINPAKTKIMFPSVFLCLPGSFSGLLHLQRLDLSSNSLHFIQYGVLEDLYFLSELKLGGNPWVCDYR